MRPQTVLVAVTLAGVLALSGCGSTQVAQLSTSLGVGAFENMGDLNQRDVHIALVVDQKLRDLNLTGEYRFTKFEFPAGEAFTAKLIKALSYNFRRITLLKTRDAVVNPVPDATLEVGVQDSHLSFEFSPKWATDRKSTRLNSSHIQKSRMPSSA